MDVQILPIPDDEISSDCDQGRHDDCFLVQWGQRCVCECHEAARERHEAALVQHLLYLPPVELPCMMESLSAELAPADFERVRLAAVARVREQIEAAEAQRDALAEQLALLCAEPQGWA